MSWSVKWILLVPVLFWGEGPWTAGQAFDDGSRRMDYGPLLRFMGTGHVEFRDTAGLLDLTKRFTIEAWVRWSPYDPERMYLFGDCVWPKMSPSIQVEAACGWVLRTGKLEDGIERCLDFTIGTATDRGPQWLSVLSKPRPCTSVAGWHHIAVCRTTSSFLLFWNGKLAGKTSCRRKVVPSPTPIYLGVHKGGWNKSTFRGDIRAFRLSSKARYTASFTPPLAFGIDDDTILLLDLTKKKGDKVADAAGNRDGTIRGARYFAR